MSGTFRRYSFQRKIIYLAVQGAVQVMEIQARALMQMRAQLQAFEAKQTIKESED